MSAIFSVVVVIGISVKLKTASVKFSGYKILFDNLISSVQTSDISKVFMIGLLFFLFLYAIGVLKETENVKKEVICAGIPALFFGLFMSVGYSFSSTGDWSLMFDNLVQVIKFSMYSFAYSILFFFGIVIIFHVLDKVDIYRTLNISEGKNKWICRYLNCLEQKTFITVFLSFLVVYIPYMILSYPGILGGDSYNQIVQAYNVESFSPYMNLISDEIKLNNHHPVMHTMLVHVFLRLGGLVGNYSLGLGLYSLFQTVIVLAVLAWTLSFLRELGVSLKIIIILMLYYILHPRISAYMYLMTKDILFVVFLLMFLVLVFKCLLGPSKRSTYGLLAGSSVGMMLFRNDGIYILVISFLIMIVCFKKVRKHFCMITLGILVMYFVWNSVILPGLSITAGGRREMLSLPLQQTARYVRDAGDEVTAREKEAINRVVKYNLLAEKYNPVSADPVKAMFREKTATTKDLKDYFLVWYEMFWKHPEIYIQATLHHKFDMFYFNSGIASNYSYESSISSMSKINGVKDEEFEVQLSYPEKINNIRTWYQKLREGFFKLPVINLFLISSTYINSFIVVMFYGIRTRNTRLLVISTPLFVQLLILIAGPTRATYFRYIYPIAVLLPIVIVLGLYINGQAKKGKEEIYATEE